jgi:hypothetical protein
MLPKMGSDPPANKNLPASPLLLVVKDRSVQDIRTLHRVEEVSGHWIVTRTTALGKGIIG